MDARSVLFTLARARVIALIDDTVVVVVALTVTRQIAAAEDAFLRLRLIRAEEEERGEEEPREPTRHSRESSRSN